MPKTSSLEGYRIIDITEVWQVLANSLLGDLGPR
jgi:hypothetical protein